MYKVTVTSAGGYKFSAKTKDGGFDIDAKGAVGPLDVLLAALGSCVGVYIRKYAEGAKFELGDYSITAEAEFTKEPPTRFATIDVKVDLKGAALDDRRKKALTEFIKNCPVHNTLKGNPEVKISV